MDWFKSRNTELSDAELLAKAKQTSSQDFAAELFSRYIELIYGVCLKYIKHEEKAKDAVMEIYEKFIKKIKTHNIDNFNSWIYVVSKNHCFEILRKEKRKDQKKQDYDFMQSEENYHPFSEDEKELQLTKLEACVEKLVDAQKICVSMFYLEKKSYKEIAEKLNKEWSSIRSLIQNGRRNLKNCMETA